MLSLKTARRSVSEILHNKVLQTVTLLAILTLSINWYFLGFGRLWSDRIVFNNLTDNQEGGLAEEIRTKSKEKTISFNRIPVISVKSQRLTFEKKLAQAFEKNLTKNDGKQSVEVNASINTYNDERQAIKEGMKGENVPTSHVPHPTKSATSFPTITESSRVCPKLSLQSTNTAKYGLCKPHKPSEGSCKFARETYAINPELSECKQKGMGDVCKMEIIRTSEISFRCNQTLCNQGERGSFKVHSVDPTLGTASIVKEFSTIKELEIGLPAIVRENKQNKFNFVFIECVTPQGQDVSQFIPTEPDFTIEETQHIRNENFINVNVLLIDSVARAHFYRSLPRTVATFKKWRESPNAVPAKVFDFELFQALHGHTAENTHALFTGELFPIEDRGKTLPVNMSAMFGHFKRAGYHTIFQEDLCWKGIWGLMLDLGEREWSNLQSAMKTTFIDHTGTLTDRSIGKVSMYDKARLQAGRRERSLRSSPEGTRSSPEGPSGNGHERAMESRKSSLIYGLTHSSCKILDSFGVDNPFSGPQGDQICYNGKFQHTYFLRYITDTLHAISASRKALPLFSYMALNVAHDHRSIRTQTLDADLERYVTDMAQEENTLTIILADHGNTYTRYTSDVLEGRFEMFHPSLFIIVPDKVASRLGNNAMSALAANQRRLVTMIELHHSLLVLAKPLLGGVKQVGLFTPMSPNRTCDDLELRTPNLCVCEGWDVPADNDTSRMPIAEFAIGQLNNRIQEQHQEGLSLEQNTEVGAGKIRRSCQRLLPLWFENVRERNSKTDGSLITSMDIRVAAGDAVPQREDIFHVEVWTKEIMGKKSLQMKLLSYDRLTLFGKYAACADHNVELKLCVCSQNATKTRSEITPQSPETWERFGQRPSVKNVRNTQCLKLIIWNYDDKNSKAYELANFCQNQSYRVKIEAVEASNVKFSRQLPFYLDVKPGGVLFALSVRKHISYWNAQVAIAATVDKE